jgi:hypothetical protein
MEEAKSINQSLSVRCVDFVHLSAQRLRRPSCLLRRTRCVLNVCSLVRACMTVAGCTKSINIHNLLIRRSVPNQSKTRFGRLATWPHTLAALQALGNVISALTTGKAHVPYRDAVLTQLMKDCLGACVQGACVCVACACVRACVDCPPSSFTDVELARVAPIDGAAFFEPFPILSQPCCWALKAGQLTKPLVVVPPSDASSAFVEINLAATTPQQAATPKLSCSLTSPRRTTTRRKRFRRCSSPSAARQ